jgi:dolichol-phosphate mannosyltransferase
MLRHSDQPSAIQSRSPERRSNKRRRRFGAVSVVVPTRNEAGNVDKLVERLDLLPPELVNEVIFVDDSTDDTPEAVERAAARSRHRVVLVHRPPARRANGLGGAVVEGIERARGAWICVMDGDLQHPPELIPSLLERARQRQCELVVASRFAREEGASSSLRRVRGLVSKSTRDAARFLFPRRLRNVRDPMSGFFLVKREAVATERLRPRGFKILLEIVVRTPRLRATEVPFSFGKRYAGESKASFGEGLLYLQQLIRLRFGGLATTFTRFGLVGASGLLVNMAVFALLVGFAGLHYLLAAVLATQCSTLSNFLLTERFVFTNREPRLGRASRAISYFAMNNATLLLRGPMLVLLVATWGMEELLANFVSLVALTVVRFGVADSVIWSGRPEPAPVRLWSYDVHGIVTVVSDVALPELEAFGTDRTIQRPTVRVRIGKLNSQQSTLVAALAFLVRHTRYDERLGRFGFGIEIGVGKSVEVLASPLLKFSPHVLYTNVVEPILRWTFVKKGYALVHAACVAHGGQAFLITARTDTGKTTTILKLLDNRPWSFLSDDLTLVAADGRVFKYPKPLTISRHTVVAVKTPLLSRFERLALFFQSRLHSRSGRRFALILARTHLPTATINALVQLLVPPPKYHIDRLVPQAQTANEAHLAGLFVIQRGGEGTVELGAEEAVDTLLENSDDAYGFPPYPSIATFLHSGNGRDLRAEERAIVARSLSGLPASALRSESMDWWRRVAAIVEGTVPPEDPESVDVVFSPA